MTDKEIIKALECCAILDIDFENCKKCPYYECKCGTKEHNMPKDALDLINRLQAENERLEKTQVQYVKAFFDEFVERLIKDFLLAKQDNDELNIVLLNKIVVELADSMNSDFNGITDFADLIRAEAIKEFTERLKELYEDENITDDMHCSVGVIKANIDDVKKEMVGEE